MADDPSFHPDTVTVSSANVGTFQTVPPSFLERWGVVFLAWIGGWILLTGSVICAYYLWKQPPSPSLASLTPDQAQAILSTHKLLVDQWRDSLNYVFNLLITNTALPIVTLLLGYLFGRGKPTS